MPGGPTKCPLVDLSRCTINERQINKSGSLLKTNLLLHLRACNVRMLKQPTSCPFRTLDNFYVAVCYISETCTKHPAFLTAFHSTSATFLSCFSDHVLRDPISSTRNYFGFETFVSLRAEHVPFDQIPVNSRFHAVQLRGSVCISSSPVDRRYLFVVCPLIVALLRPKTSYTDTCLYLFDIRKSAFS